MINDIKTIIQMLRPERGESHAERLENFYGRQASNYDAFRKKLLPGRSNLIKKLAPHAQGHWADFGCGTAVNLELMGAEKAQDFEKIYMIDLSPSLLQQAKKKVDKFSLSNVKLIEDDVCQFVPDKPLDLVTFSYSLTMIPQWFKALDRAIDQLKPGGVIGIVDFYVASKHPLKGMQPHSSWTRGFWPLWFSWDNVRLNPDHLPYLMDKLEKLHLFEGFNSVPYAPFGQVPYYMFVGRKPQDHC